MGSALKKQKTNSRQAKPVEPEVSSSSEPESDAGSAGEEEALDDLDMDDEVDVDGVSSGSDSGSEEDSDEESGADDDDDESLPKLKKKKNLDDGSESFAGAFNAILGSKLKAYDRKEPILARSKQVIKKLESDKLEAKAKRAILAEKKSLQDKHRVTGLLPSASEPEKVREILDHERKLKKVAQKGVVRLFNAILSTQVRTTQDMDREIGGQSRKEELMNEISKEKFLDLVQAAGQD